MTDLPPLNGSAVNATYGKTFSAPWGYGAIAVSCFSFGTNFVPVKRFDSGDGVFFQFVMCSAIMVGGFIVNCIRNFPKFHPLVLIGGAMWTTGNMCVVPIINMIGLGLGLVIWASVNMLTGWAARRFGLFGLKMSVPSNIAANFAGIGCCIVSNIVFMMVKTEVATQLETEICDDGTVLDIPLNEEHIRTPEIRPEELNLYKKMSPIQARILGCLLSVVSGVLYGLSFVPYLYVQDNYPEASPRGLDYIHAHYMGIFLTSLLFFIVYSVIKRNQPRLYPKIVLPGLLCGIFWIMGCTSWFIANEALSEVISFPMVTSGPGIIAALWGILVFKEIRGKRNLITFLIAATFSMVGIICVAISKL